MTDQALLISMLREAGRIIGEYIEPGPRDAEQTLTRLPCWTAGLGSRH